ncbi:stage V sporulation protein AC [Shouchella shacheensis]|uniref:stage V sporulation protein AC n=1 Tax=Shouchella shacheensis TaxID=1649580 RepID=UPI0007404BB7|nr:stage V sporulation protein AC [Shouchella shacheensis]
MLDKAKQEQYKKNIALYLPKPHFLKHSVLAFVSGGLFCVLGQALLRLYEQLLSVSEMEATGYMLVTLIACASLATGMGWYNKWAQELGAGLLVPMTGFANAMTSAALEHRSEGLISGIGAQMLKLVGPIIVFGIVSAYVVSFSRLIIRTIIQ